MMNNPCNKPDLLVYEHPFNERIRLLLRLEVIFAQAISHQQARNQYETHLCLDALFALLNITNRYELRSELLRELERIKNMLQLLQRVEDVSDEKVRETLGELGACAERLHGLDSKHIESLRNIEFLNTVKHRNHDTGNFLFELPALQYWLSQSANQREEQIKSWLSDFLPLHEAVKLLLRLNRESAETEMLTAENGVYIKKINERSSAHQLLRIVVEKQSDVYPRVSGDNYRFSIRFMEQKQIDNRAKQAAGNVRFTLLSCGL